MASSGVWRTAKTPPSTRAIVLIRTTNLFFSEKSMMARSINPLADLAVRGRRPFPMLFGDSAVRYLGSFDQPHSAFGTFPGLVGNHVRVLLHGAGIENGGRGYGWRRRGRGAESGRCGHHRNQGHAATRALARLIFMNVAVLRHRT